MFVKPAPDPARPGEVLIVRDPLHMTPIPASGRRVPDISYWHQRVRDGDLIPAEAPEELPVDALPSGFSDQIEPGDPGSIAPRQPVTQE